MRKCCIISKPKIRHKNVNKNLLFLTRKLAPHNNQLYMGYFAPQHNRAKRMAKKEVVLVQICEFSVRKVTTYKKSAIKCTFRPPKGLKLQETKRKSCFYLWQMNGKERERKYMRVMAFFKKCGVALTHHHGNFLESGSSGHFFLLCEHQIHLPYTSTWNSTAYPQIHAIPNQK